MISRHIDEFVVPIITASLHKQWEGKLILIFCLKKTDYYNKIFNNFYIPLIALMKLFTS